MIKPLSLYVHIPFCDSKCYYCSFISSVQNNQIKDKYFIALNNEIISQAKIFDDNYNVKTIYIGGGTPSSVQPAHIEKVLDTIRLNFNVDKDAEITMECNPNSTSQEKLMSYKKMGINRLSFGVQSFNKHSLEFIGRIQNDKTALMNYKKNVIEVLKKAKSLGFENISVDFILGLPFQKNYEIKSLLKKMSKFVSHFSCYMLMVEENTKLFKLMPNGANDEKIARQYETAVKILQKIGFERYEISNFAKSGFESKHNKVYWEMREYLGFGLSAHSFYDNKRIANTEKLNNYVTLFSENKNNSQRSENFGRVQEILSNEQLAEERIMLSLRTIEGLDLISFKKNFYDIEDKKRKEISILLNSGFIEFENNFLRLSDKGYLVANKIILELI